MPLFGTRTQTFYLEPFGTTRLIVIDGADGVLVIAIEPTGDSTLESMLPEANRVVATYPFPLENIAGRARTGYPERA